VVITTERTHIHNAEASCFRKSLCVIFSKMCYIRHARLQTVTSPEHVHVPRSCTKLYAARSYELPSRLLPLAATCCYLVIPIFFTLFMVVIPIIFVTCRIARTAGRSPFVTVGLITATYLKIDVIRYSRIKKTDVLRPCFYTNLT
jgi:hypothetical protein